MWKARNEQANWYRKAPLVVRICYSIEIFIAPNVFAEYWWTQCVFISLLFLMARIGQSSNKAKNTKYKRNNNNRTLCVPGLKVFVPWKAGGN